MRRLAIGAVIPMAFSLGPAARAQPEPRSAPVPRSAQSPAGFRAAPPRGSAADNQITCVVSLDDPDGRLNDHTEQIRATLLAAGAAWGRMLDGSGSIEVVVSPSNDPTSSGRSVAPAFVRNNGACGVVEQAMEAEALTGEAAWRAAEQGASRRKRERKWARVDSNHRRQLSHQIYSLARLATPAHARVLPLGVPRGEER